MGLREDEYTNQLFAWTLLNGNEVKIPQPYRFMKALGHDGVPSGYLIMEHVPGECLDSMGTATMLELVDKVARAVFLLYSKSLSIADNLTRPGPLSGNLAEGFPWGDNTADTTFSTVDDLEQALNRRLRRCPRSLKRKWKDHQLRLTAGLYPPIFEAASLSNLQGTGPDHESEYFEKLRRRLNVWIPDDDFAVEKVNIVQSISTCYALAKLTLTAEHCMPPLGAPARHESSSDADDSDASDASWASGSPDMSITAAMSKATMVCG
ncbi:hypothetical protein M409DRAFT_61735 [Zasmidium cellare ATCC 36951]|uniref:Aminoglycoside phosphotransferase domain-containing protein n=1 Tax=Zasmidium cellare ATCC 36951 TaxID=1080233 RepID=A0A6A6BU74_ZASCE|nr:uncharacterized protein M409DRAFT_61735 [Zasmidium cellare ATCC 36951]KAF2158347.1 hypothetical protein M409DRAFT_61735 [Zasmidium cellare ATCC 36951]